MDTAKVYFTDMRCKVGESLLVKLERLIRTAGIEAIPFKQKYVAIKIHFGEPGNLSFLRPNFAKTVADRIKALGGLPFLTDCNTLYVGRRNNALVHMDAAFENGYSPLSTGCQNIIADGLGFFEVMVFLLTMSLVLGGGKTLTAAELIAYCGGFAAGNLVGSFLEQKLVDSYISVEIIAEKNNDSNSLVRQLREAGFGTTVVPGEGRSGPRLVIKVVC